MESILRTTTLNVLQTNRDMIREFGGYSHRLNTAENQFYDMKNMTSDFYPLLSPRAKRSKFMDIERANGFFAKQKLLWVSGDNLYYNGELVGQVEDSKKEFVSMGAYVLIFPDKKIFNTHDLTLKDMEAKWETVGTVTYKLTREDGEEYDSVLVSATAPDEPEDRDLWMDTSSTPHTLKQWTEASAQWVSIATTYIRIESTGIGKLFSAYDGVTISGSVIEDLNTDIIIYSKGDDYIVVTGILDMTATQDEPLTITRTVPDMDFLTEHQNRVWGCSSKNHEVYCCKQGDPTNWRCYMGLSTDSYAATIGSDGDFTGAVTYMDQVLFFKEDKVHIIQGTRPANYQIGERAMRGVERGSEKSLAVVDEVLLYKSPEGVCFFTGSLPTPIYDVFGGVKYRNAVAGGARSKYCISMEDMSGVHHLFVYDVAKGLWHKEDNLDVAYFARLGDELYFIDSAGSIGEIFCSTNLYDNSEIVGIPEESIEWMVETGDMGMDSPDQKTISRFLMRVEVEAGSSFTVAFQYDSDGEWRDARTISNTRKHAFTIPIIPRRCDHMRMRITGVGDCKIYSISKETEQGSELNGSF